MTGNAFLPTGLTHLFGTPANPPPNIHTNTPTTTHTPHMAFLLTKEEHEKKMAECKTFLWYLWGIIEKQEACQSTLLSHELCQLLRIHECLRLGCTDGRVIWGRLLICVAWGQRSGVLIYSHSPLSCLAREAHTSKRITCIGKNNKMTNLNTSLCQYVTKSFCFFPPSPSI